MFFEQVNKYAHLVPLFTTSIPRHPLQPAWGLVLVLPPRSSQSTTNRPTLFIHLDIQRHSAENLYLCVSVPFSAQTVLHHIRLSHHNNFFGGGKKVIFLPCALHKSLFYVFGLSIFKTSPFSSN